jgi:hypothetical protein
MALFHRRDLPPAAATAAFGPDERVVSWADTAAGSAVLATSRGLWWPDAAAWRLIGWHEITKAIWRDGALVVTQADVLDDLLLVDRTPVAERLSVARDLPPTVRRRFEANVVRSELVPVAGGAARVVGRHVPGSDGLSWWARLEAGTTDTERVRTSVSAHLARLRADWEQQYDGRNW